MKTQTLKFVFIASLLTFFISASANTMKNNTKLNDAVLLELNAVENESELEIEEWMVNDQIWKVDDSTKSDEIQSTTESDVAIQNWMTDDTLWKMDTTNNKEI